MAKKTKRKSNRKTSRKVNKKGIVRRRASTGLFGNGKKGMELSINFFVMLIIIVTIFSGSVAFLNKFYKETVVIEETISRDTENQIQGLLRGGNVVAIPLNKKDLRRGQSETFWLGILNIIGEDRDDFKVIVKFAKAFTSAEELITEADPVFIDSKWILFSSGPYAIKNNDFRSVGIKANANNNMASGVATEKGTYIFNVCVYNQNIGVVDADTCAQGNMQVLSQNDALYTGKVYKMYVEVV